MDYSVSITHRRIICRIQIEILQDKLSDADKEPLQKAIEKTREVAKGDDVAAIKSAVQELEQVSQAFSKSLYESQAASGGDDAAEETADKPGADDAIDAEFEVKDS